MEIEPRQWVLVVRPESVGGQIRRLPPSLNGRMHWARRRVWTALFRQQVAWQARLAKVPKLARARVEVVNRSCHPMDRDNLYSAAKPLIDGLVDAGVVPDDSERHIDEVCRSERAESKRGELVLVTVTEIL